MPQSRLWFIEGCDGVGKTTVVRELKNRSNHKIGNVHDRGPVSHMIWNPKDEELENGYIKWFDKASELVGIIFLISSWEVVGPRLLDEMAAPGYNGPLFTRKFWETQQNQYVDWGVFLQRHCTVPNFIVDATAPLDEVLRQCAQVMGFPNNIFATKALYFTGMKEATP